MLKLEKNYNKGGISSMSDFEKKQRNKILEAKNNLQLKRPRDFEKFTDNEYIKANFPSLVSIPDFNMSEFSK